MSIVGRLNVDSDTVLGHREELVGRAVLGVHGVCETRISITFGIQITLSPRVSTPDSSCMIHQELIKCMANGEDLNSYEIEKLSSSQFQGYLRESNLVNIQSGLSIRPFVRIW